MSVLLTKYNSINLSASEPITITYQLNKRCKNLPEKVSLPYFIKALDMQKQYRKIIEREQQIEADFSGFAFQIYSPRAYARGLFHLIRDGDIFREFLIYIPLENCVTPISLFTYAPQALILKRQKIQTPTHNDSGLEFPMKRDDFKNRFLRQTRTAR